MYVKRERKEKEKNRKTPRKYTLAWNKSSSRGLLGIGRLWPSLVVSSGLQRPLFR
jgi:hypothetical protein